MKGITDADRTALYIAASLAKAGMLSHVRVDGGSASFKSDYANSTTVYTVWPAARKLTGLSKASALAKAEEWCGRPLADLPGRPARGDRNVLRAWELQMAHFAVCAGANHIEEERSDGIYASCVGFRLTGYEISDVGVGLSLKEKVSEAAEALGVDLPALEEDAAEIDALARAIDAAREAEDAAEDASDWSMIADSWARIAREQRKRDDED